MKLLLVLSLSILICLSHCKIEIEEVDEFEEFEELPRTDADTKFKEDLSPISDKAEVEVTVEVCSIIVDGFESLYLCGIFLLGR